jgi:GMP synthase-like glutamine amidotransferase
VRALAIVHQPDAGPGVFAEAFAKRGDQLDSWEIAQGADPPADPRSYDAVLSFGGAMNAHQEEEYPWLRFEKDLLAELLAGGMPLLGVCLGAQLLAEAAGATPRRASRPEIGWHEVEVTPEGAEDPLLAPLAPRFSAFQWHSYEAPLPPAATALARSPVCLQAYRIGDSAWGIQFHAEVSAPDAEHWFDDYRSDPDAVRIGIDPEALRAQTRAAIRDWNRLGRELCERFIEATAR